MKSFIRPNRMEVSDRFPVLGFTVGTDSDHPFYEIAIATDPHLFDADKKPQRSHENFYSTRSCGSLAGNGRESVFLLPDQILNRFVSASKLYFGLATFADKNRANPTVMTRPSADSPWINIQTLTGRRSRRSQLSSMSHPQCCPDGYCSPDADELSWAGDAAEPGMRSVPNTDRYDMTATDPGTAPASPVANPNSPPASAATSLGEVPYDDGFGPMPNMFESSSYASPLGIAKPDYAAKGFFGALKTFWNWMKKYSHWKTGVPDTSFFPHSAIVQIFSTFPGKKAGEPDRHYVGTGFYIGPNLILTCAHNVADWETDQQAKSLTITPGKNGAATPSAPAFQVQPGGWAHHENYLTETDWNSTFSWDLAVIHASTPAPNGQYFTTLEELLHSPDTPIMVCGYSARTGGQDKQNIDGDHIRDFSHNNEQFSYRNFTEGGSSGGPVYYVSGFEDDEVKMSVINLPVVAVNVAEVGRDHNIGCVLNTNKIAWIRNAAMNLAAAATKGMSHGLAYEPTSFAQMSDESGAMYNNTLAPSNDDAAAGIDNAGMNLAAQTGLSLAEPLWSEPLAKIPMDPGSGGRSIDATALEVGDIILTLGQGSVSSAIKLATWSEVSHSMLYVGDNQVVEAIHETGQPDRQGVTRRSLAEALSDKKFAIAFRHPAFVGMDADYAARVRDRIVQYANNQLGKKFDFFLISQHGLLSLQLKKKAACAVLEKLDAATGEKCWKLLKSLYLGGSKDKFICSEFVLSAFSDAGLPLVENPNWYSPADVGNMDLSYVGHLLTAATASSLGGSGCTTCGCGDSKNNGQDTSHSKALAGTNRQLDKDALKHKLAAQGIAGDEVDLFLNELSTGHAMSLQTAAPTAGSGTERVVFPSLTTLSGWKATAFLMAIEDVLPKEMLGIPTAAMASAKQHGFAIAFGLGGSAGIAVGLTTGGGVVFGSNGEVAFYGTSGQAIGVIASVSVGIQVTIVKGGISNFMGEAIATTGAAGEGVGGSFAILTSPSSGEFLGITGSFGLTAGLSPVEIYVEKQKTWALSLDADEFTESQAVVEIGSAIAGATMQRIMDNNGDVKWKLDKLNGFKHVGDDKKNKGPGPVKQKRVNIPGFKSHTVFGIDEISTDFDIKFQYDGRSVGNILITPVRTNDAFGAGLMVTATISNDARPYCPAMASTCDDSKKMAAVQIEFHYRFDNTIFADKIGITEVTVFGSGEWTHKSRVTQP